MGVRILKLSRLSDLQEFEQGLLGRTFEAAVEEVTRDVRERCTLKGKRKVTLELTFEPQLEADKRKLRAVEFGFEVKRAMPAQRAEGYQVEVDEQGDLSTSQMERRGEREGARAKGGES